MRCSKKLPHSTARKPGIEKHQTVQAPLTKCVEVPTYELLKINSSLPWNPYVHWWTESSFVEVVACRIFGTKSLPEAMLIHYQSEPVELNYFFFNSKSNLYIEETFQNVVCNVFSFLYGQGVQFTWNTLCSFTGEDIWHHCNCIPTGFQIIGISFIYISDNEKMWVSLTK